jgi:hypothetical protein
MLSLNNSLPVFFSFAELLDLLLGFVFQHLRCSRLCRGKINATCSFGYMFTDSDVSKEPRPSKSLIPGLVIKIPPPPHLDVFFDILWIVISSVDFYRSHCILCNAVMFGDMSYKEDNISFLS